MAMKLRSTTPVSSKGIAKRAIITLIILTIAVATPLTMMKSSYAGEYDDQINAIQQKIDGYEAQAKEIGRRADTLQRELEIISNQKAVIQAQIDLSQAQADKLKKEIEDNEKRIAANKEVLGQTLADMYVEGKISPLEMLASTGNIGDYLDKQEYLSSIRDTLKLTIDDINKAQEELEKQKKDVEVVLANQTNSRNALKAKEDEHAVLVATARNEEAEYQKLSAAAQEEQGRVRAAQQAAIAAAYEKANASLVSGTARGGAYPWNDSNCWMGGTGGYYSFGGADGNGGDGKGYGCRQCASYVAWRVNEEIGVYPLSWGNATNFPESAWAANFRNQSSQPMKDSIAVMRAWQGGSGPEGHVAYVDDVYSDGTVLVSQYNYNYGSGYGMPSQMKMDSSAFQVYIKIK